MPFGIFKKKKSMEELQDKGLKADLSLKTIFGPEFCLNDLELLETIGTGTFSRIRLVKCLIDQKYYALKILKKAAVVRHGEVQHIINEVFVLSRIRCPLIVDLAGMFQDDNNVYICLDYVPGGELFSHLRRKGQFSEQEAKFFAIETAAAIRALHEYKIVHRDLKPENICLSSDGHVRLIDFGYTKVINDQTNTLCGTPEYLAPEVVQGHGYGLAVDWWGLGILLHEMLYGYPPFYGHNPFEVYEKILKGTENVVFPRTPVTSGRAADALRKLLTRDRRSRAGCGRGGFSGIRGLGFFSGTSWDSVPNQLLEPPLVPTVEMEGDSSNYDFFPEETVEEPSNLTQRQRALFDEFDVILARPKQTL